MLKKILIAFFCSLILAAAIAQYVGVIDVRKIVNTEQPQEVMANAKSTSVTFNPAVLPPGIEKRVALVIGNAKYQNGGQLANTVNDASDIAASLQQYNFEVILKTDASLQQMTDAIDEFGEKLKTGGVGLFFYSGHGIQVKGENYLVPVDGILNKESDVKRHMINVNEVLEKMGEGKTHLNLVFLDACRDNPFRSFSRSMSKGLGKMDAPSGTLIAYATSPDDTASDGSGRNSPYTGSLLKALKTEPNTEIGLLLRKVTKAVKQETKGDQEPWMSMSIDGEFYFAPPEKPETVEASEMPENVEQHVTASSGAGVVMPVTPESPVIPQEPAPTTPELPPAIEEQPITQNDVRDIPGIEPISEKNASMRGYVCNVDPKGDNFLSLRSGPKSNYPEILRMGENTGFLIVEVRGSWYRVKLDNGVMGWAYKGWVCLAQ
jgi:hypothetical protein